MSDTIFLTTLLAWRNLWRNHRRTLIMLSAISLGIWAMIFLSALLRGMLDDMYERSINSLPGHLQISTQSYLDDPNIENSFAAHQPALQQYLLQHPTLKAVARLTVPGVITSERDMRGVRINAINPALEDLNSIDLTLLSGAELSVDDSGIIIGQRLAQRLETDIGRRIVITTQGTEEATRERGLRVVGIYNSDLASLEETEVYLTLANAQALTQAADRVTVVAVFIDNEAQLTEIQQDLQDHLPSELLVRNWRDINPYLASMIATMDVFIFIWVFIVFIALSFGLVNTFVMAVFERTREIGLMLALGLKPRIVLLQVLVETVFLLLIGGFLGNVLAFASLYASREGIDLSAVASGMDSFGMAPVLTPKLNFDDWVFATITVIILGLLTSLLPAWRAAKLDPIRAINSTS